MSNEIKKESKGSLFVNFIIERMKKNKGIAAVFRRADNPATEYQCWEQLALFHIELDKDYIRLPYVTVAAAVAKAKSEKNGATKIGCALANCYENGKESDQAKAKLRRLLACDSVEEVCRILRPVFSLILSKSKFSLDYAQVLNDLLGFHQDERRQKIKSRWAQDFYRGKNTVNQAESVQLKGDAA